jgi:hypothetical protein
MYNKVKPHKTNSFRKKITNSSRLNRKLLPGFFRGQKSFKRDLVMLLKGLNRKNRKSFHVLTLEDYVNSINKIRRKFGKESKNYNRIRSHIKYFIRRHKKRRYGFLYNVLRRRRGGPIDVNKNSKRLNRKHGWRKVKGRLAVRRLQKMRELTVTNKPFFKRLNYVIFNNIVLKTILISKKIGSVWTRSLHRRSLFCLNFFRHLGSGKFVVGKKKKEND